MDHEHGHRGHEDLRASHSDDRCGAGGNAVNFDCHLPLVIHEHIVDLGRSHAVAAGGVDPDGDISVPGIQLVLEKLGSDVIVKPAFLRDGAAQKQCPLRRRPVGPVPEFLHQNPSCCSDANAPAFFSGSILPLMRYRSPPSSAGMRSRFSSSRISLADIQPFWRAVA